MQTKLFRKVPKLQNMNRSIDFKLSKTSKNVEKQNWMKLSPNMPRTSDSITFNETQEGLCAQPVFKKQAKNKRKQFEARNKKEKETSDLPSFLKKEDLEIIPKSLVKKLKKKNKNSDLQGNSEELLNVEHESCVQDICEEGLSQEKQRKKSKKVVFTGLNTHSNDFGGERDVVAPFIYIKNVDLSSDDIRINKSKKRKHTLLESCNSLFQEDLLNDDFRSKILKREEKFDKLLLKQCKKICKDSGKPEVSLESKGILKRKKEFLLQSDEQDNIQENTVCRKKNKNTKLLVHKNIVMSQPSMKRNEETRSQSEKRGKIEQLHSENTDVVSDTEESHAREADEKCFRLDYEGERSIKQKKRKRKNSKISFDDVMQGSTSEVNHLTTSKKSKQINENISVLENEDLSENNEQMAQKEQLKNDSANFIELPKKKMRGFDGREDTPERLGRTVFVGNLPLLVDKKVLQMLFRSFGKIESVRLRSVVPAKSSISKKVAMIKKEFHSESNSVNGYVVFKNSEDAKNSLALNKTVFQGHHIRVDLFRDNTTYDNKRSVFVGNLPYNVTDEKLWEVFGECGNIEAVRIVRDPTTGIGKGFGFVLFEKNSSVKSALELNDTEVNGRSIRVKVSEGKVSKQKESEPQQNKRAGLKIENIKKSGFRLSGQKKTKKKLIKKQRGIQKKKRIASILSHK